MSAFPINLFVLFVNWSYTLSATGTAQRVQLGGNGANFTIVNSTTVPVFVRFGNSTVTATASGANSGAMVLPLSERGYQCGPNDTHVSIICGNSGSGLVGIARGTGI